MIALPDMCDPERASIPLQGNIELELSSGKVEVFLNAALTWGTNVLQGLCRDKGRGERLDGALAFPAYIARTFAFECT